MKATRTQLRAPGGLTPSPCALPAQQPAVAGLGVGRGSGPSGVQLRTGPQGGRGRTGTRMPAFRPRPLCTWCSLTHTLAPATKLIFGPSE